MKWVRCFLSRWNPLSRPFYFPAPRNSAFIARRSAADNTGLLPSDRDPHFKNAHALLGSR